MALRIAFLTPEYVTESNFDGGLANYLHRVAVALHKSGHAVDVFTSSAKDGQILHDGVTVHRINHDVFPYRVLQRLSGWQLRTAIDILFRSFLFKRRFLAEHQKKKFDVVQASSYMAPAVFLSKHVSTVTRISSFEPMWRAADNVSCSLDNALSEWLELVQMKRSGRVYAPSALLAKTIPRFEPVKIDVLRPPVDTLKFKEAGGTPPSLLGELDYLLFFGTINRSKGIEFIWRNLSAILSENPGLNFVFVGKGDLPSMYKELTPLRARIIRFGPLKHDKLLPIIKKARAVVLPSMIDNLPNTCIESMCLGKVVVGTRGASFDEIIVDGSSGYLLDYGDDCQLQSVLKKIAVAPLADLEEMGTTARSSVMKMFESSERVKELENYFEQAIAGQLS